MKKTKSALPVPAASNSIAADSAASDPAGGTSFAPPCFYWKWCSQRAAINKAGRSVCRRCAGMLRGIEYPLRDPSQDRRNLFRHHAAIASAELDPPL